MLNEVSVVVCHEVSTVRCQLWGISCEVYDMSAVMCHEVY